MLEKKAEREREGWNGAKLKVTKTMGKMKVQGICIKRDERVRGEGGGYEKERG